jgi:hypothetical protein
LRLTEWPRRVLSFSVWVGGCALIVCLLITKLIDRPLAAFLFLVVIVLTGILSYKGYEHPFFKGRPW